MLLFLLLNAAPPLPKPVPVGRLGPSFLDGIYHAQDVAFRRDGKLVFAGGHGVSIIDLDKRKVVERFPDGPVYRAWPVGENVLVGGYSLRLVETGGKKRWDKARGYSYDLEIGHDGKRFAAATQQELAFGDLADGKETHRVRFRTAAGRFDRLPTRLACCPVRPEVALLTPDGSVSVRDKEGKVAWTAHGHARGKEENDRLGSVAYSPDGAWIATASTDRLIRLWDARTGKPGQVLSRGAGIARSLAFSSKGVVAASLDDGTIRLFDAGKERILQAGSPQFRVAFSPDGRILASASIERMFAELWDVATGERLHAPEGHLNTVAAMRFVEDGRLVSVDERGGIVDWTLDGAVRTATMPAGPRYRRFAISPDGKLIAEAGKGAGIYDATGKRIVRLAGTETPYTLAFTRGGLSGTGGRHLMSWKLDGSEMRPPIRVDGRGWVFFTPDGKQTLTSLGIRTAVIDLATGATRVVRDKDQPPYQPAQVAFTPDGRFVAWTTFGKLILCDAATWEPVLELPHEGGMPAAVALSRDGRRIAVTRVDNGPSDILCYDAVDGKKLFDRPLPLSNLMHCPPAFSPDGTRLATANGKTILVWDVPKRPLSAPLDAAGLEKEWKRLSASASEAHRAGWALVDAKAVRFLASQLKPVDESPLAARLIADLDSDDFKTRADAEEALAKLARRAEAAMEKALAAKPSLEAARRMERLLAAVRASPESMRLARAVSVLARMGAKEELAKLAKSSDPRLSREAREALGRMEP